ncbi:Uncharacterised protein [uncultured archaeon]|nr:Uncharacterised protein [uncultured archaeon]
MRLTPNLRAELKQPLGAVVSDVEEAPLAGKTLVCVGDCAAISVLEGGYRPQIIVYDRKTKRKTLPKNTLLETYGSKAVNITNPAGTITQEAFATFKEAYAKKETTRIFVDGEEDLLTLPAIAEAPLGYVVLYGQPDGGLVVVNVNNLIKGKVAKIIGSMEDED